MAYNAPILSNVAAFDAIKAQKLYYSATGSNVTFVRSTLTIIDNETGEVARTLNRTTFGVSNIGANLLVNGKYYSASIVVYGTDNTTGEVVQSPVSNSIQFRCYSTPTFSLNVSEGDTIGTASYTFELSYNQSENEPLNGVTFNLYNSDGVVLKSSGFISTVAKELPITVNYTFTGLENNTAYSVAVNGKTLYNTILATGKINFTTMYASSSGYTDFVVSNNCKGGYITLTSNIVSIAGDAYPSPTVYIDNSAVDVRTDGSYIMFESGYRAVGNFKLRLWGRQFNANSTVIKLTDVNGDVVIIKYIVDSGKAYLQLDIISGDLRYVTDSDSITVPLDTETVLIAFSNIENMYNIQLVNLGVLS